jgi:hypothetical protein
MKVATLLSLSPCWVLIRQTVSVPVLVIRLGIYRDHTVLPPGTLPTTNLEIISHSSCFQVAGEPAPLACLVKVCVPFTKERRESEKTSLKAPGSQLSLATLREIFLFLLSCSFSVLCCHFEWVCNLWHVSFFHNVLSIHLCSVPCQYMVPWSSSQATGRRKWRI